MDSSWRALVAAIVCRSRPVAPVSKIRAGVPKPWKFRQSGRLLATTNRPVEITGRASPMTSIESPLLRRFRPCRQSDFSCRCRRIFTVGGGGTPSTPGTPVSTPPGHALHSASRATDWNSAGPPTTVPPAGPPSGPPIGGSPTTPAGPPPVSAPEPSALLLVAVGLGCLFLRSKLTVGLFAGQLQLFCCAILS